MRCAAFNLLPQRLPLLCGIYSLPNRHLPYIAYMCITFIPLPPCNAAFPLLVILLYMVELTFCILLQAMLFNCYACIACLPAVEHGERVLTRLTFRAGHSSSSRSSAPPAFFFLPYNVDWTTAGGHGSSMLLFRFMFGFSLFLYYVYFATLPFCY